MSLPSPTSASQALLTAALGGLLGLAGLAGCSSSSTGAEATNEDTPQPSTTCKDRASESPTVTSTTVDTSITSDSFKSQCEAKNGIFEVQPQCGGSNACRGMSFDSKYSTLTEHNCRATNTCAGYSCVVCD